MCSSDLVMAIDAIKQTLGQYPLETKLGVHSFSVRVMDGNDGPALQRFARELPPQIGRASGRERV